MPGVWARDHADVEDDIGGVMRSCADVATVGEVRGMSAWSIAAHRGCCTSAVKYGLGGTRFARHGFIAESQGVGEEFELEEGIDGGSAEC